MDVDTEHIFYICIMYIYLIGKKIFMAFRKNFHHSEYILYYKTKMFMRPDVSKCITLFFEIHNFLTNFV